MNIFRRARRALMVRRELRSLRRAFLATKGSPVIVLPPSVHDCNQHAGATIGWSPRRTVLEVTGELADARAELERDRADAAPLLDDFHRRMAAAWRRFDAAMLAPMQTTAHWHAEGADVCQVCAQRHAATFGAIGERFGIRSFRIDTPTAEYKIYAGAAA